MYKTIAIVPSKHKYLSDYCQITGMLLKKLIRKQILQRILPDPYAQSSKKDYGCFYERVEAGFPFHSPLTLLSSLNLTLGPQAEGSCKKKPWLAWLM